MSNESKPYVIVVGIDYSEPSELAFDKAFELAAEKPRADVHVLNVMALNLPALAPGVAYPNGGGSLPSLEAATERLEKHIQKKLDAFRTARGYQATSGVRVVPHLRLDTPTYEIAQLAADLEADLVVVGTHGRRALSRVILGSVAEVTVRLSPCPVLVMRPKAAPAPIPTIQPACPRCVEARKATDGKEYWCEQHRERHGQRHTYHQGDRAAAETNMPLVVR
jgi:nucleotide-binding universal stress UspA family protein